MKRDEMKTRSKVVRRESVFRPLECDDEVAVEGAAKD